MRPEDCGKQPLAEVRTLSGKLSGHDRLRRPCEDGPSIPTDWFEVASHYTSDMLTTSGVTELLARAKGKCTFIRFYLESPQYKFVSTHLCRHVDAGQLQNGYFLTSA